MAKYRLSFLLTTIWLLFIFNIERLDYTIFGPEPFNLHTAFYAVSLLLIITMATFPNASGANPIYIAALAIGIHFAVRWLWPFAAGASNSPLIIGLEALSILVTTLLMRRMSEALHEFEFAAETFILGSQSNILRSQEEGQKQIDEELYLARRFNRPIALVYCELNFKEADTGTDRIQADNINMRITDAFKHRFAKYQLVQMVNTLTYKGDTVADYQNGLIICLPETSVEEAQAWTNKLNTLAQENYNWSLKAGFSTFPDSGLVFEDLARAAYDNRNATELSVAAIVGDDRSEPKRSGEVWIAPEARMEIESKGSWYSRMKNQSHASRELYTKIKRIADSVVVLLALPFALPIGLLTALFIYLEDGGSPFYLQERTGYRGNRFKMYKFRSMRVNAQAIPAQQIVLADGTVRHIWPEKTDKDPRVTRIGAILRKTSLDELPQLLNVLNGDMSLVGPRPSSWNLDKYTLHQTERLTVRPGITGLWQVCARDSKNMDERLLWDMKYIDKLSPWLDIQILVRTVLAVFLKKGI